MNSKLLDTPRKIERLQSGVRRFENLKQNEEKGLRPLYRKRSFDEDEKKKRKEEKKRRKTL